MIKQLASQDYVEVEKGAVNLTMAFAFDSAVLLPEARLQLNELCVAMQSVDIEKFNVYGHTDAVGSFDPQRPNAPGIAVIAVAVLVG